MVLLGKSGTSPTEDLAGNFTGREGVPTLLLRLTGEDVHPFRGRFSYCAPQGGDEAENKFWAGTMPPRESGPGVVQDFEAFGADLEETHSGKCHIFLGRRPLSLWSTILSHFSPKQLLKSRYFLMNFEIFCSFRSCLPEEVLKNNIIFNFELT